MSVLPYRLLVKYFSHTYRCGIARMKHHFARIKENVSACTSIHDEVREISLKLLDKEEANNQE